LNIDDFIWRFALRIKAVDSPVIEIVGEPMEQQRGCQTVPGTEALFLEEIVWFCLLQQRAWATGCPRAGNAAGRDQD
jgi:hypothetical protein